MPSAGANPRVSAAAMTLRACSCTSGLPTITLSTGAPPEQNKSTNNAAASSRKTMLTTVV